MIDRPALAMKVLGTLALTAAFQLGAGEAPAAPATPPEAAKPVVPEVPVPPDAPPEEGFERLFNGKDLTGWEGDTKIWLVEDGQLIGRSPGIKRNEFLGHSGNYPDFELRFKFRLIGLGGKGLVNSGCQFRSQRVSNSSEAKGYQADIGDGWWGALYDESRRNKVLVKPAPEDVKKALVPGGWNEYTIICKGDTITTFINGVKMIEWTETEPADKVARDGRIFFQVHSGAAMELRLKDIRIKKL